MTTDFDPDGEPISERQPPGVRCTCAWIWDAHVHPFAGVIAIDGMMAANNPVGEPYRENVERLSAEESAQLIEDATRLVVNPRLSPTRTLREILFGHVVNPRLSPTRTLREILFSHRALAQATTEQITDLMVELKPLFQKEG